MSSLKVDEKLKKRGKKSIWSVFPKTTYCRCGQMRKNQYLIDRKLTKKKKMIHSKKSYPRICFRGVFIKMCLLFF